VSTLARRHRHQPSRRDAPCIRLNVVLHSEISKEPSEQRHGCGLGLDTGVEAPFEERRFEESAQGDDGALDAFGRNTVAVSTPLTLNGASGLKEKNRRMGGIIFYIIGIVINMNVKIIMMMIIVTILRINILCYFIDNIFSSLLCMDSFLMNTIIILTIIVMK